MNTQKPFEVGDKVICICSRLSCLQECAEYVVSDCRYAGEWCVMIEGVDNRSFYPERFTKKLQ